MNVFRMNRAGMVFWGVLIFFSVVADSALPETLMTPERIQEIIDRMDAAIDEKKADEVVRYMSPDISIDVLLIRTDGNQRIQMGREGYRQHLNRAFQSIDDYVFSRSTLKIDVAPDGKTASAVTRLKEKMTVGNRVIRAVTREVSEFKVIRGEVFMTSVRSVSNVEEDGNPRFTGQKVRFGPSFDETRLPGGKGPQGGFFTHGRAS